MTFRFVLRAAGASLVALSLFHAVLWRTLDWGKEITRISRLSARVFAVHTFFIAFVLGALGLLSLVRPDLLLVRGDLARVVLSAVVVFWIARLVMQPLVFDPVMRETQGSPGRTEAWTQSLFVRLGATLLWIAYVAVYGAALSAQLGAWEPR